MRKVVSLFVGIVLCAGIANAQSNNIFESMTEEQLKSVYLLIADQTQPTPAQIEDVKSILKEYQSISAYLYGKYFDAVKSDPNQNIESLWDSDIGLQKENFELHTYYRAIYGYYLAAYSAVSETKLTWTEIDEKNKFGYLVYHFIKADEACDKAIQQNPDRKEHITGMKNVFAYASGKDIPESKLKTAWINGLKKEQLTGEDNKIFQYLFSNELKRLTDMVFAEYAKDPERKFDNYWDRTFWLKLNKFEEHRYYRQMLCSYLTNRATENAYAPKSTEMKFINDFGDFVDCDVLNTQSHYEFPWFRKLERKRNKEIEEQKNKSQEEQKKLEKITDPNNLG